MAPAIRLCCPACGSPREAARARGVMCWPCAACRTVVLNVSALRRFVGEGAARLIWRAVLEARDDRPSHPCPTCSRPLHSIAVRTALGTLRAAGCRSCRVVAFDGRELDAALVAAPPEPVELTAEQVRALARRAAERVAATPGPMPALTAHFRTDRGDRAEHGELVLTALLDIPWLLLGLASS